MLHLSERGFAAWGFCFRFESTDAVLRDVVARCYCDLPAANGPVHVLRAVRSGVGFRISIEAPDGTVEQCGDGRTGAAVLELICWEVNRRATRSVAHQAVLHAAVVGGPLGAVALCGSSRSGKSTLAAAAARRGWRHLSDDMGLLDVAGPRVMVTPYARPIMLRPGGRDHLGNLLAPPAEHMEFVADEWFVPASELGATVSSDPQPLVAVGFLEWRDGACLEPLSRARTLHDLLLHSATLAMQGAEGFAQLERVATSVPGHRVGLGTVDEVLELLAPLVGAS